MLYGIKECWDIWYVVPQVRTSNFSLFNTSFGQQHKTETEKNLGTKQWLRAAREASSHGWEITQEICKQMSWW
jgi:hypothetical protein